MAAKLKPTEAVLSGRFSYLSVFEPRTMQDGTGEPKYSLTLMINKKKGKADIAKIEACIEAAKKEGVKSKVKWGGRIPKNLKVEILKDGDEIYADQIAEKKPTKNPEYKGNWILRVSSLQRPSVVDADMNEILDKNEIFSGCFGKIAVNFFPFEKGSNGVSCGLNHVMKTEDGEALAGRVTAADAFGSDDDDDDLLGDL